MSHNLHMMLNHINRAQTLVELRIEEGKNLCNPTSFSKYSKLDFLSSAN